MGMSLLMAARLVAVLCTGLVAGIMLGDHMGATFAQCMTHHFRSGNICARETSYSKRTQTGVANENIAKNDTDYPDQ